VAGTITCAPRSCLATVNWTSGRAALDTVGSAQEWGHKAAMSRWKESRCLVLSTQLLREVPRETPHGAKKPAQASMS
jgi:hypothetical protein